MNIDKLFKQLNKDFPDIRWYKDGWGNFVGEIDWLHSWDRLPEIPSVGIRHKAPLLRINGFNYLSSNYPKLKSDILCAIKSIKGEK